MTVGGGQSMWADGPFAQAPRPTPPPQPLPAPSSAPPAEEVARSARAGGFERVPERAFEPDFVAVFDRQFPRLYRFAHRYSGDAELAADLTQEAFVRLYQRGEMPASPEAWLVSVLLNLFRNARTKESTRRRLLTTARAERAHSEPPPSPDTVADPQLQRRVRVALDGMPERERQLLLLHAEGYAYREIAAALALHDGSVGTLLARAKRAFRARYGEGGDAD